MTTQLNRSIRSVLEILVGALLLGMLWRFRGSHGWGAAWGVLACGFVFLLYLVTIVPHKERPSFSLIALTAFSFMLTTPSWGTFLSGLTGIQELSAKGSDAVTKVFVHPASAIFLMLCLGYGMVAVFGALFGKCFGEKTWRIRDFVFVLVVFYGVTMLMQATFSHVLIRLLQPECVRVFSEDLQSKGILQSVYRTYLSHFGSIDWGKKYIGGRHYFAAIEAISRAFGAIAVQFVVRFAVRDRQAARTAVVVSASFAFAIALADLFFFFGGGGYHGEQGFVLPDFITAWSSWEYSTGFLAGGLITAYVRRLAVFTRVSLPERIPKKAQTIVGFILFWVAGVGVNVVRPMLLRMERSALHIPLVIFVVLAVLAVGLLLLRQFGWALTIAPQKLSRALVVFFAGYFLLLYLFAYEPQVKELRMLYNILVLISFCGVLAWGLWLPDQNRLTESDYVRSSAYM